MAIGAELRTYDQSPLKLPHAIGLLWPTPVVVHVVQNQDLDAIDLIDAGQWLLFKEPLSEQMTKIFQGLRRASQAVKLTEDFLFEVLHELIQCCICTTCEDRAHA